MEKIRFLDEQGTFSLAQPENYSNLYFPAANELGLKGALTPNFGGDCKLDQNTFLLEPSRPRRRTARSRRASCGSACGAAARRSV